MVEASIERIAGNLFYLSAPIMVWENVGGVSHVIAEIHFGATRSELTNWEGEKFIVGNHEKIQLEFYCGEID